MNDVLHLGDTQQHFAVLCCSHGANLAGGADTCRRTNWLFLALHKLATSWQGTMACSAQVLLFSQQVHKQEHIVHSKESKLTKAQTQLANSSSNHAC
jgi:hypothetical protein